MKSISEIIPEKRMESKENDLYCTYRQTLFPSPLRVERFKTKCWPIECRQEWSTSSPSLALENFCKNQLYIYIYFFSNFFFLSEQRNSDYLQAAGIIERMKRTFLPAYKEPHETRNKLFCYFQPLTFWSYLKHHFVYSDKY